MSSAASRSRSSSSSSNNNVTHMNITQHFVSGENAGKHYFENYFVIEVKIRDLMYSVDRSVLDFVELDKRLRKRFPRNHWPKLPLAKDIVVSLYREIENNEAVKKAEAASADAQESFAPAVSENLSGRRSSFALSANDANIFTSMFGYNHATTRKLPPVEVTKNDNLAQKCSHFADYLKALLEHHEIIVSEEFLLFFDEEVPNMGTDPDNIEPLTIHDILLLDEPVYKCIVRKSEEVDISVNNCEMIVWKFSTVDYDIAFGVDLNDEVKVSYTRYNSHLKPVCGTLLVDDISNMTDSSSPQRTSTGEDLKISNVITTATVTKGVCKLKFDNSYAKLHTKKLSWSAKVVSFEEYHAAKETALEVMREKHKFEVQRNCFKRNMIALAASLSGVIHSASIEHDFMEEESTLVKEMHAEALMAQEEVNEIRQRYDESQEALEGIEQRMEEMTSSWKFTNESLQISKDENEALKSRHDMNNKKWRSEREEYRMANNSLTKQVDELKELLHKQKRELSMKDNELQLQLQKKEKELQLQREENVQLSTAMHSAMDAADQTVNTLTSELASVKSRLQIYEMENENKMEHLNKENHLSKKIDALSYAIRKSTNENDSDVTV